MALLLVAALAAAPRASSAATVAAPAFLEMLRSGGVSLTGATVEGDVNLAGAVVSRRVTCRDCRFTGDLIAAGATFEQPVDLGGSEFGGKVDLSRARLEKGLSAHNALFREIVDLRHIQVTGPTDLSEATFLGPVLAGGHPSAPNPPVGDCADSSFCGALDVSLASFASLADFESTNFGKTVDFRLAHFGGDAFFADSEATRQVLFTRATFDGSADFGSFVFDDVSTFEGAQFNGPADFRQTSFQRAATFDRARFAKGATFLAATFPEGDEVDSFNGVESDGDLNFTSAEFDRKADFEYMVVKGTLSFQDAELGGAKWLDFTNASIGPFLMSGDAARVAVKSEDRSQVLALIESSAKNRGDLAQANDAHYANEVLKSQGYSPPLRVLDLVFYRSLAGYFVRPLHPLLAVLGLAALVTLVRLIRRHAWVRPPARRSPLHHVHAAARRLFENLRTFGAAFLETLTLIPPGGGRATERQSRQVEVWTYRILFACALIGFANSNPTLRQMLDAVS